MIGQKCGYHLAVHTDDTAPIDKVQLFVVMRLVVKNRSNTGSQALMFKSPYFSFHFHKLVLHKMHSSNKVAQFRGRNAAISIVFGLPDQPYSASCFCTPGRASRARCAFQAGDGRKSPRPSSAPAGSEGRFVDSEKYQGTGPVQRASNRRDVSSFS